MKSSSILVDNLCCLDVGDSKINVFAENHTTDNPLIRKAEFIFEIDSSTKKQTNFSIYDLHSIMGIAYNTLIDYIEHNIIKEIQNLTSFQLLIEVEGNDDKDVSMKNNLYHYLLKRLAKKITKDSKDVMCVYTKDATTHYLTFTST